MTLIYLISPPARVPSTPPGWDKLVHTAAYGLFGTLSLRAFHGGLRPLRPLPALLAVLLTLGYAMFDEIHQSRIPGREASLADWLADAVGAGLSILLVGRLAKARRLAVE
jgi:VanZ family protein